MSGKAALEAGLVDANQTAHEVIQMAIEDTRIAGLAEAAGLTASASFDEVKARVEAMRAAAAELDATKAALAKAEADRIARDAQAAAEAKAREVADRRAAFAAEVTRACSVDRVITPDTETALLAHYDAHGEASARATFGMVKATKPIVQTGPVGFKAETSSATGGDAMSRMTAADFEHCKRNGLDAAIYAERKYSGANEVKK